MASSAGLPDIVPLDSPMPSRRRSTEGSRYAEGIVLSFLRSGAVAAEVRWRETPYSCGELYELLRRCCRKKSYRALVGASKCDSSIQLYRRR